MATMPAGPVPTPQNGQRSVPGAQDSTKPAQLEHLPSRKPTHAVTGPPSVPVTGKPMPARQGMPPLHRTGAHEVKPKEQKR